MSYTVVFEESVVKTLKKMDRSEALRIYSWIIKNLEGCENPRKYGKALRGNHSGEWRYRVGDYRILATIDDKIVRIHVFEIGKRNKVYE